ncbi:hypothetical protein GF108_11155 [Phyllobacterium sp. SYP-B3895]|uniref:hypothetical protein n=1 Tax=Phyllobacterium sp. SYP-B3895 TaxID=2663240 RepID=UPI001299B221|nr:hypothetical protein [Phyllobacterium sp. SYP-B3895]MRG56135.1 hypothetical protein [Phyllobacterium sp. SYP-B3895]
MLRQTIAATAMIMLMAPAYAGGSIDVVSGSATPNSIFYVGFDSFDATGNPICTPCEAQQAAEAARLKAYAERRERSRQYMARLQGREVPVSTATAAAAVSASPIAANAAELVPAGEPVPQRALADVADTPLRTGLQ